MNALLASHIVTQSKQPMIAQVVARTAQSAYTPHMSIQNQIRSKSTKLERSEKISIIVGSLILGLLRILSTRQQNFYDIDRYMTLMRRRIQEVPDMPNERAALAGIAYNAMLHLVDQFPAGKSQTLQFATFIESISFSFEKELLSFFGAKYFDRMSRAALKLEQENTAAKTSYEIADALRDNIRKLIFERIDKK